MVLLQRPTSAEVGKETTARKGREEGVGRQEGWQKRGKEGESITVL